MQHKNPPIIALTGPAGCGKSATAAYLALTRQVKRTRFADPLKAMLTVLLSAGGISSEIANRMMDGDLKDIPTPALCGRSPRYAMQMMGTEWGRDLIHDDLWVELWKVQACKAIDDGAVVVVDDCRFVNEAKAIKSLGGIIVGINGRGGITGNHVSESGAVSAFVDYEISNDGSMNDLFDKVARLWLEHCS